MVLRVDFERVEEDFHVRRDSRRCVSSRAYTVTVIRPPHVERIDLRYEYPAAFRMAAREEEDGGDIYGPAGTRVRVTVHVDKPVTRAALNLTGGSADRARGRHGDDAAGGLWSLATTGRTAWRSPTPTG